MRAARSVLRGSIVFSRSCGRRESVFVGAPRRLTTYRAYYQESGYDHEPDSPNAIGLA